MSTYRCDLLYPYGKQRSYVETIENNLRKGVYSNELASVSVEEKKIQKQELVKRAKNSLNSVNIKGFNCWAFVLGVSGFHVGRMFQTKKLFSELGKAAGPYAGIAIGVGLGTGFVVGQLFSYDMGLYSRWRSARNAIAQFDN